MCNAGKVRVVELFLNAALFEKQSVQTNSNHTKKGAGHEAE